MPLPNQYARCNVIMQSDQGTIQINVLHYTLTAAGAVTQAQTDAFVGALATQLTPAYQACMASECLLLGYNLLVNDTGISYQSSFNVVVPAGGVAVDTTPDFVAWIIRKQTAAGGKTGRGRWYIGCLPESFTDSSALTDSFANNEGEDLRVALTGNVSASGKTWVPSHLSVKDDTLLPIVSSRIVRDLATQRRRLVRSLL